MHLPKTDRYPLKNAPMSFKLLSTLGILVSVALLAWSWTATFGILKTHRPSEFCQLLGDDLWALWQYNRNLYILVYFFQAVGYAVIYLIARLLFKRTSLRRRMKSLLLLSCTFLALLNQFIWITAPFLRFSQATAGYIGLASAAALVALTLPPLFQMWFHQRWKKAKPTRIVIVGGGFAGLYTALGLDGKLGHHQHLEIVLIDKKNFFLFPPLLPSAAVGTVETRQVTHSFRRIFETTNVRYEKGEIVAIDPAAKVARMHIHLDEDEKSPGVSGTDVNLSYDYLVLAPGSVNQTFNTKGCLEYAFFLKELTDAMKVRNRIIDCFERAAVVNDETIRRELLRFAVVGGGPTGVEIATEIHDLIHEVLLKRYPEIPKAWPEVSIIQSGTQILPGWPEKVVRESTKQLHRLGVKLVLNNRVMEVKSNAVVMKDGDPIATRTTLWCAGVQPSPLLKACALPLDKSGRVAVDEFLRVPEHPEMYVLGDSAATTDKASGKQLPPIGQVAFQQGDYLAKSLSALLRGEPVKPFSYFNFGALVSVGEHYAAVDLLGVKLTGFLGWFVWRTLYLSKIVGLSNKIRIMIDWTLDLLIERSIAQLQEREPSSARAPAQKTVETV